MLIRVDYSGLLDLPIFTRYQYIAIVGEKVSCVFLINHYLSLNKCRGRDTRYRIPPAQIPACAIYAPGS
ncbi:hypothetical protein, partial [Klebsiella pneumoniae]